MTETETTARPPATIRTAIRTLAAITGRARQLPSADQNGETR
jgi:hypothetical protein